MSEISNCLIKVWVWDYDGGSHTVTPSLYAYPLRYTKRGFRPMLCISTFINLRLITTLNFQSSIRDFLRSESTKPQTENWTLAPFTRDKCGRSIIKCLSQDVLLLRGRQRSATMSNADQDSEVHLFDIAFFYFKFIRELQTVTMFHVLALLLFAGNF
jgi:hypothetical protein